jgi:predicted ferric reductase
VQHFHMSSLLATTLRSRSSASQIVLRNDGFTFPMARSARIDKAGTDWAALLMGLGIGLTVALELTTMRSADFRDVYQWIDSAARVFALVGTYFALVGVLFVARIPWVERGVGHDRLVTWHRKLTPYSLFLIGFHVLFVVIGFSGVEQKKLYQEIWFLLTQYGWMWWALAGLILMITAGVTSYKKARAKMSYETWWLIHISTYGAIAASFMHQIVNGPMFINHPLNKAFWIGLYVFVFASIAIWRLGLPIWKSIKHDLKVDRVVVEGPGIVSIIVRGRSLHKLGAQGGQFFNWRFAQKGHLLVQHPYSLSAAPTDKLMRITVKNLGDHSADVIHIRPGVRVFMEGPYGAFTKNRATRKHVLLVGGGVGITPIRAIAEEFGDTVNMDLIYRVSNEDELILKEELEYLAERSNGALKIHYLVGSRYQHPINAKSIQKIAPYFADSDIYVCGPEAMVEALRKAAREVGVPKNRFHDEAFEFHTKID